MKTKHDEHALRNLTNRVMAVIDDEGDARRAVETLERAGVAERELATLSGIEGVRQIDADGVHSGGVKHLLRALQGFTVEGSHLRQYQTEITSGHRVLDVCVHGRWQRDKVVEILRHYRAHFINAYGQWTIESVAA